MWSADGPHAFMGGENCARLTLTTRGRGCFRVALSGVKVEPWWAMFPAASVAHRHSFCLEAKPRSWNGSRVLPLVK